MSLPSKTAQVFFTAKEQAELREAPVAAPKEGEVFVRSTWTLISTGTETICYGRRFDPGTHWENWVKYPFATGYSQAGVVEAVGAGVTAYKPGDRVCSIHGHALHVCGPANTFYPIPEGISERDAAWFTLSYIVQNGIRRAHHELGEDVVVIGLGPLGQLAVQFVKQLGPRRLIALDPIQKRLDWAKKFGATHVLGMSVDEALPQAQALTGGRLADAVYDMTGNDKVFARALDYLRKLGKLVLIGDTGTPAGQHLTGALITKSLQVIASHATNTPPQDTPWAHWTRENMIQLFFEYLKSGRMNVGELNTHAFSPAQAQEAYQLVLHKRAETMGVHFDWSKL